MIKTQIILYAITFDKQSSSYLILSDHPEKFKYCYKTLNSNMTFHEQLDALFVEYFNFQIEFVRIINIEPFIENEILYIPFFCLVPYSVELKKGFLLPVNQYAIHIPAIRKILNII